MSLNQTSDYEERRGGHPQTVQEIVQTSPLRPQSRILALQRNEENETSMSASRLIKKRNNMIAGTLILSVIFFFSGAVMSRIPTSRQAYGAMYLIFSAFYFPHCVDQLEDHGQDNGWRLCITSLNLGAVAMYYIGALGLICEDDLMGFSGFWIFGAILSIIQFTFKLMEYIRKDDRPKLKLLEKSVGILTSLLIIVASFIGVNAGTDWYLAAAVFHALYCQLVLLGMFFTTV